MTLTPSQYRNALYALDACNLSGVVHDWSTILEDIWEEARAKGQGTDYVNHHPINVLLAEKVKELAGGEFSEAYRLAKERAETPQVLDRRVEWVANMESEGFRPGWYVLEDKDNGDGTETYGLIVAGPFGEAVDANCALLNLSTA